jgi:hypothetical protein
MPVLRCPYALRSSHGRNQLGFGAKSEHTLVSNVAVGAGQVVGIKIESLSLTAAPNGRGELKVAMRASVAEAEQFIDRLEVALTSYFGVAEKNAYYRTVFIEFDRVSLDWKPDAALGEEVPAGIQVGTSTFMTSIENHQISSAALAGLQYDPLLQLYADGLKASTA